MRDSPLYAWPADALEVRLHEPVPGVAVVRLAGELDLLTAPLLRDQLHAQLRLRSHVVVDLEDVTFIGSHGLAVLVDVHNAARAAGIELFLTACAAPVVARVLTVAGLVEVLPITELGTDELVDRLLHCPDGSIPLRAADPSPAPEVPEQRLP